MKLEPCDAGSYRSSSDRRPECDIRSLKYIVDGSWGPSQPVMIESTPTVSVSKSSWNSTCAFSVFAPASAYTTHEIVQTIVRLQAVIAGTARLSSIQTVRVAQ